MEDLDLSRPTVELFPEVTAQDSAPQHNSYQSDDYYTSDQAVVDPLNTGAYRQADVAGHETEQNKNFRALREEISKMQAEREYWKGQADAYSRQPKPDQPVPAKDPYQDLDWQEPTDLKRAFDSIRQENQSLRSEIKDALKAVETKSQRHDWDSMVTQHIPHLTSTNPIFAEMIQNTSNPYEAAYLLAQLNARASNQQPVANPTSPLPPQHGNAQRAIENSQKPQTLASVGGRGQMSQVDYYANMSDKDFQELASRNLANI